jgi:hypothetical protein
MEATTVAFGVGSRQAKSACTYSALTSRPAALTILPQFTQLHRGVLSPMSTDASVSGAQRPRAPLEGLAPQPFQAVCAARTQSIQQQTAPVERALNERPISNSHLRA